MCLLPVPPLFCLILSTLLFYHLAPHPPPFCGQLLLIPSLRRKLESWTDRSGRHRVGCAHAHKHKETKSSAVFCFSSLKTAIVATGKKLSLMLLYFTGKQTGDIYKFKQCVSSASHTANTRAEHCYNAVTITTTIRKRRKQFQPEIWFSFHKTWSWWLWRVKQRKQQESIYRSTGTKPRRSLYSLLLPCPWWDALWRCHWLLVPLAICSTHTLTLCDYSYTLRIR